jgi:hypothetical protein
MDFSLTPEQQRWRTRAREFSEKIIKPDASSFLHSDGTNQLCLLRASQAIANQGHAALYGF